MVTAEMAVALPALMIVLMLCVWGILAGALKLRCEDAARIAARSLARGDSEARAREIAHQTTHRDATVDIRRGVMTVKVTVRSKAPIPKALRGLMPELIVSGDATSPLEKQ